MRRVILTALVLVVAPLAACGALLGVDDVGYGAGAGDGGGSDAALEAAATDAPADGRPTDDAGVDAARFCASVDAALCADFDEGDLVEAYVSGGLNNAWTPTFDDGGLPLLAGGKSGQAFLAITPSLATLTDRWTQKLDHESLRSGAHVHLSLSLWTDELNTPGPNGEVTIFRLKALGGNGVNFRYKVPMNKPAVLEIDTDGEDGVEAPHLGTWQAVELDLKLAPSGPAHVTFSNGGAVVVDRDTVTIPPGAFSLTLGSEGSQGPMAGAKFRYDDVVVTVE